MIYIELVTDAFEEVLAKQQRSKQKSDKRSGAGRRIARRPTRGLEIKDDTYAILKLVNANGRELPLIDSSSPDGSTSSGYANFMLQSVQEARMEKHQIIETFGDSYVFFFGEAPRFIDVSAVIINSLDFNWEAEWWENYNKYLRGTKSVELGARTYLFYDDNIVEGYILQAQAVKSSDTPLMLQMNFRMFVTNSQNISFVGDPNYPVRSSVFLPYNVNLTAGNAGQMLIDKYRDNARDLIIQSGGDPTATTVSELISKGLPAGSKISELIRMASPSIGISPDTWAEIQGLQVDGAPLADTLRELAERTGRPIRGLIAENTDEYVGANATRTSVGSFVFEPGTKQLMLSPIVRKQWESEDLFRDSVEFLTCYGADINSPGAFIGIGLGVNFSASASVGASFTPTAKAGFGFGTTEHVGLSSRSEFHAYARDSLGAVYGSSSSEFHAFAGAGFSASASAGVSASASAGFGYHSDFSTGPGYGETGFGDFGGDGFGCGAGGAGDPGFRPPRDFTFAGVADNRDSFKRFLRPKPDPTAFGIGVHVGASIGLSAGVSFGIGGSVSAFGMIAVGGTLDDTGSARSQPGFASAGRSAESLGFANPNPFGVQCPSPGGFGFSKSFP